MRPPRDPRRAERRVTRAITLRKLRRVAILYDGDFWELASFMLKVCAAKDRATGATSRPTVHGVATAFERVAQEPRLEAIEGVVVRHGLDLGAAVHFDDGAADRSLRPEARRLGPGRRSRSRSPR